MEHSEPTQIPDSLYLDISTEKEEHVLPLYSSITLFLLSYCESTSFRVILLSAKSRSQWAWLGDLPSTLASNQPPLTEIPGLVSACRLPAVVEADGVFCRAGLAVVLRHVTQRTSKEKPGHLNVASLLGFKNTCLKACAEVSKWTRLCEIDIPTAVENHLCNPTDEALCIPPAVLLLEKRLGEPVKVHNDDKLRRQKLQQQTVSSNDCTLQEECVEATMNLCEPTSGVELSAALAKLTMDGLPDEAGKRPPDIRRVKTTDLPKLEHHFAEGLYFTLTDVVLLPCIHQYLLLWFKPWEVQVAVDRQALFLIMGHHILWLPLMCIQLQSSCFTVSDGRQENNMQKRIWSHSKNGEVGYPPRRVPPAQPKYNAIHSF